MLKFKTWDKDKIHPVRAVAPLHTLLAFMLIKLQVILMIITGVQGIIKLYLPPGLEGILRNCRDCP